MACTSMEPVWTATPAIPTMNMTPPSTCMMAYRVPARRALAVPPHHTMIVEKIAITSQNTNSVTRSPAKAVPTAPPAYANAAASSYLLACRNEYNPPIKVMIEKIVANKRLSALPSTGSIR